MKLTKEQQEILMAVKKGKEIKGEIMKKVYIVEVVDVAVEESNDLLTGVIVFKSLEKATKKYEELKENYKEPFEKYDKDNFEENQNEFGSPKQNTGVLKEYVVYQKDNEFNQVLIRLYEREIE